MIKKPRRLYIEGKTRMGAIVEGRTEREKRKRRKIKETATGNSENVR